MAMSVVWLERGEKWKYTVEQRKERKWFLSAWDVCCYATISSTCYTHKISLSLFLSPSLLLSNFLLFHAREISGLWLTVRRARRISYTDLLSTNVSNQGSCHITKDRNAILTYGIYLQFIRHIQLIEYFSRMHVWMKLHDYVMII